MTCSLVSVFANACHCAITATCVTFLHVIMEAAWDGTPIAVSRRLVIYTVQA